MKRITLCLFAIAGAVLLSACDRLSFFQPTPTSTRTLTPTLTQTPTPTPAPTQTPKPTPDVVWIRATIIASNKKTRKEAEELALTLSVDNAVDCGSVETKSHLLEVNECVKNSFRSKQPFRMHLTSPADDFTVNYWIVGSSAGDISLVHYEGGWDGGVGPYQESCANPMIYQNPDKEYLICNDWDQPPPEEVTIFVGMGTGTDPSQVAVHKEIAELYNSTHDKIQIEFYTSPWGERLTKYSTMLAADQPPDIVMPIGVGGISDFYRFPGWLDLTPYIERDSFDMSRFYGVTGELHNYPGQGVLGLPMCVYPTGVFYNVDIFDAAGVDYPPAHYGEAYADGDPWTYEKLNEIARLLTLDANGNNAASPAFDPANIVQFGWNGWDWGNNIEWAAKWGNLPGTGVSADGKTSLLNTPQYIDFMKFAKQQIWDLHIRANGEQAGAFYQNAGNPMESGMVAMWEIHSWMGYAYPGWSARFKWNIGAVPAGPNGKQLPLVDADTAVIPVEAKNPEAAWEVMKWFYTPEIYDRLIANYNCMPADTVSLGKWIEKMQEKYPGVDFGVFVEALDYIETYNHESWKPNYTRVNDEMTKAWNQIASGDNLDVVAVMKAAHEAVQKLLDDYWAANP